ncbi:MAG: DNA translocase FtsK [Sphingomonadales bacterium]
MARQPRSSTKLRFLPAGLVAFLRRRLTEIGGILVLGAAAVLLMSLASHSPGDPSFNTATASVNGNWISVPGAYTADILLQTLGLGSALLVLALAAWSWRITSHRGLPRFWLHLTLLPISLLIWATFLSLIPGGANWPIESGLGGVVGLYLLSALQNLTALGGLEPPPWLYGIALGLLGVLATTYTLGIERGEWRAIGSAFGWIVLSAARPMAALVRRSGGIVSLAGGKRANPKRAGPGKKRGGKGTQTAKRVASSPGRLKTGAREAAEREPTLALEPSGDFVLPPLNLLAKPPRQERGRRISEDALEQNARMLETVLDDFGVHGEITMVRPGPVVTLYELEPAPGTKSSRVIGLADDIARSMSAVSARVAVVPGRNAIGIELPNRKRETVYLREILSSPGYENTKARLALALGKDIGGHGVTVDLSAMPHMLIAGTTGSGKSVAINTMILSLLYRVLPDQCKFIMIDPKMLELSVYDGIPHLLTPVVTDPKKAIVALKWAVKEMEDRYRAMSQLGVRNIDAYNLRLAELAQSGEVIKRTVQTGFDSETGKPIYEHQELDLKPLPWIVIVIDEMADLMLVAGKEVEAALQRLAQMARAAGLHLITATQRPSVDVITGTIKANFPTRISFQVTSRIDSRTILGEQGAEQLLGRGDMLYMAGGGRITRVHGAFVSDGEVEKVVADLKAQGEPSYVETVTEELDDDPLALNGGGSSGDELYDRAVELVARERRASTSFIQRHLQIGYNRAARIIERMEKNGVVGPANHVGKREILVLDHGGD